MSMLRLYLASASPRRLELLREIGLDPQPVPQQMQEHGQPLETPRDMVLRLAEAKARIGAAGIPRTAAPGVVLGADTAVVAAGEILGKPRDAQDAEAILGRLRGKTHEVLTGVFLLRTDDGRSTNGVDCTRVRFRDFDDATIRAYVATGEPLDKAGAYGIQGGGAMLSESVVGSWSNVVGLPLERLPGFLAALGIDLWSLLPPAAMQAGDQSPSERS